MPQHIVLPSKKVKPDCVVGHDIKYIFDDGYECIFPKNDRNIRFKSREFKTVTIDDLNFVRKVYYIDKNDLPPMIDGKIYISSKIVATLLSGYRNDFAYPGTHPKYDKADIENDEMSAVRRFRLPDQLILR